MWLRQYVAELPKNQLASAIDRHTTKLANYRGKELEAIISKVVKREIWLDVVQLILRRPGSRESTRYSIPARLLFPLKVSYAQY